MLVLENFELYGTTDANGPGHAMRIELGLKNNGGSQLVSVLVQRVKRNLVSWFIQLQMKEYTIMFTTGEDEACWTRWTGSTTS